MLNFYEVFAFFMLNWLFIAAFMQVMFISFPNYYDAKVAYSYNFSNYLRSLFSMFIFFTTNNSPQMVVDNYPTYKFITLFFITIIFLNNLLLMGLLIGLSYYKMKLSMANSIKACRANDVKREIFDKLVDVPDTRGTVVKKIIRQCIARVNQPFISVDRVIAESKRKPKEPKTNSELIFFTLKKMQSYEFCYSVVNIIVACVAMFVIQAREFEKYQFFILTIFLCAIGLLDFVHHCAYWYLGSVQQNWKTFLDLALNLAIIGLSVCMISDEQRSVTLVKVWAFACIMKLYRFFIFYFRFDRKKLRSHVLYPFLRYTIDIVVQMFILYIVSASVCSNLFGGNINDYSMDNYNDLMDTDFNYVDFNFNTFLNSLVTLYMVTLNDNWPIIANMSIVTKGQNKRVMKFIFVGFKLLLNYVLINSMIAFIIETFHEHEKRQMAALSNVQHRGSKKSKVENADYIIEAFDDTTFGSLYKKESVVKSDN